MQLGKSLLGGIIGAAVGIGLLLAVYRVFGIDKGWLAIPFAIVTGLGVRAMVSTSGHASYFRGALTMLLALAGYIGGWYLAASMAQARANAMTLKPVAVDQKSTEAAGGGSKEEAAPAPPPPSSIDSEALAPSSRRSMAPKGAMSTFDIICLAIAALVAYELGRGSGISAPAPTAEAVEGTPDAIPPSV